MSEEKKGFTAIARGLSVSAFKVRPIADNVRRKPYSDAVAALEHMPNKGAKYLKKVLESAAANALFHNSTLDEDMLYIKEVYVDEGRSGKGFWPRAKGRADKLIKRTAHISVVLDEIRTGK